MSDSELDAELKAASALEWAKLTSELRIVNADRDWSKLDGMLFANGFNAGAMWALARIKGETAMAYCRLSNDNFQCDVYVYGDVMGGYTTHIARNRIVGAVPANDSDRRNFLDNCERVQITHPDAGKSFNDPSPQECADRLERLKADGLHVPQYAIDELRGEAI